MEIRPIANSLLRNPTTTILLILQAALTVAILSNLSFLIQNRLESINVESGVDEDVVVDYEVYTYAEEITEFDSMADVEAISRIPGVEAVSMTNQLPLEGSGWSSSIMSTPLSVEEGNTVNAAFYHVDEHFQRVLGLNMLHGRYFEPNEVYLNEAWRQLEVVPVVISADVALGLFDRTDVVGEAIYDPSHGDKPFEVIGVIDTLYSPWPGSDWAGNSVVFGKKGSTNAFQRFAIRLDGVSLADVQDTISTTLYEINPERVVIDVESYPMIKDRKFSVDYSLMIVLGTVIVLLLTVISLGSVGVTVFNIERRTRQIGTRRALGATKRDIVLLFSIESLLILIISIGFAIPLSRFLNLQLMGMMNLPLMSWSYPLAIGVALILLTLLGIIYPVIKASRMSPSIATRTI